MGMSLGPRASQDGNRFRRACPDVFIDDGSDRVADQPCPAWRDATSAHVSGGIIADSFFLRPIGAKEIAPCAMSGSQASLLKTEYP